MDRDDLFEKVYIATIAAIVGGQSANGTLGNGTDTQIKELSDLIAEVAYTQAEAAVEKFGKHRQFYEFYASNTGFKEWVEDFDPNPPDNQMERELQDGEHVTYEELVQELVEER